jgi:hypothetical protein
MIRGDLRSAGSCHRSGASKGAFQGWSDSREPKAGRAITIGPRWRADRTADRPTFDLRVGRFLDIDARIQQGFRLVHSVHDSRLP